MEELKSKKIRVLQVFASLNVGGAESRMMDVYRKIDKTYFSFDFVTLEEGKQFFEDEIESIGGNVFKIASPRKAGVFKHIKDLRNCIKRGQYDAVHAHTSYHTGIVMLAAFLEKVPVRIAHARTTDSIQKGIKTRAFILLGRFLNALFATKRVAISEEAGKFVFGGRSFEVIPNAIDLDKYKNPKDKVILKKELGVAEDSKIIGHVGRFDSFKNQIFIVEWLSQYPEKENCTLVFVGDGEERATVENKAVEYGLKNKVVFTGVRKDVPELMNLFDILVFPSKVEGLGGVVLEAQAAGTPSVLSNAVPNEVDMGLDLIERRGLNDGLSKWNEAVNKSFSKKSPSFDNIKNAFNNKKYSLNYAIERYSNIYSQSK